MVYRRLGIYITPWDTTLTVCRCGVSKLAEKHRIRGEVTVNLNHGVNVHKVDRTDTVLHELGAPPKVRRR